MAKAIEDIKKALKEKKAVIGTDRVLKGLKTGKLAKVFVTSNCPEDVKRDVNYYSGLSGTAVVLLEQPNDELGIICKKPFRISVLGVLKGA